jgi:hypothetical protein
MRDLWCGEWNYATMPKNEPALPIHIALRQPPDLPFPDQMYGFVTIDRPQCSFRRPEPQTRRYSLLDKSMVLLNDVV